MICQRCLFRLERRTLPIARRAYASASSLSSANTNAVQAQTATPRGPATEEHEGRPAATSKPAAAQPFSTRDDSSKHGAHKSPPTLGPSGAADQIESLPRIPSILPAGKPLTGLGYFKNKDPPVAMEDNQYPSWLWTLLDVNSKGSTGKAAALDGNLFSKSKAQRRKAAKAMKKANTDNPLSLIPEVPLEAQTIDLPAGDGTAQGAIGASVVRTELRGAMRTKRRNDIKQRNYLKSM